MGNIQKSVGSGKNRLERYRIPPLLIKGLFDCCDTVIAVDLADILHTAARYASNAEQLLKQSTQKIHSIIKNFQLEKGGTLAIFMDGPAPLAKLSTQIKRRH